MKVRPTIGKALLLVTAMALVAVVVASPTVAERPDCPSGYEMRDVRVYGQRLESEPHRDGSVGSVVVQNEPGADDPRYVAARVCTRPLTGDEGDDLFWLGVPGGRP